MWSGVFKSFFEFYGRKYWQIPNMTLFGKLLDKGREKQVDYYTYLMISIIIVYYITTME